MWFKKRMAIKCKKNNAKKECKKKNAKRMQIFENHHFINSGTTGNNN